MEFLCTSLTDAYIVKSVLHEDERGFFSRIRCSEEFAAHGLPSTFVQASISHNVSAATFRGLHYQIPPSQESKLVRCIAGAIDDVIVDLRPDSPTHLKHEWFRLSARELTALYVPPGFAHGFLTVDDDTTVMYDMSDIYAPDLSRGIRWSDPLLKIQMPGEIKAINARDAEYQDIEPESLQ